MSESAPTQESSDPDEHDGVIPRLKPQDLLIFAGAGLSKSTPSCLPLFNDIRDELIRQLLPRLPASQEDEGGSRTPTRAKGPSSPDHTPGRSDRSTRALLEKLAPEAFLSAASRGGTSIRQWMAAVLGGDRPNLGHLVLRELVLAGSRIWTVNFDELTEGPCGSELPDGWVFAWSAAARPIPENARLLKPHGTASANMLFTAEQVLAGVPDEWRERLERDVRDRIVVFIGYQAADADFLPHWKETLRASRTVIWFDFPDAGKQRRLEAVAGRSVQFPSRPGENPTVEFVRWCRDRGLIRVTDESIGSLERECADTVFPVLAGTGHRASSEMYGVIGTHQEQQREMLRCAINGPGRIDAVVRTVNIAITFGGTAILRLLRPFHHPIWRLLPGPTEILNRKSLTLLSGSGYSEDVVRATRHLGRRPSATQLVVRATALKSAGSLAAAVDTGNRAYLVAGEEGNASVRANAAFQAATALMWRGRIDEARALAEGDLRTAAELSTLRWIAWQQWLVGCLEIHGGRPYEALEALDTAIDWFQLEAHTHGQRDSQLAKLPAFRMLDDMDSFRSAAEGLGPAVSADAVPRSQRRVGQRVSFAQGALELEWAQYHHFHSHKLVEARRRYLHVTRTCYPLQQGHAWVGIADTTTGPARVSAIRKAELIARQIDCDELLRACTDRRGRGPDDACERFIP